MPTPPGDLSYYDKVNFVIDAWAVPCDAPWYVYIETLKPAALTALITLSTFGWDDMVRGYARPKQPGTRRTGKRKGKWRRALPTWPETGEEIGKRLPGADEIKGKRWGTLTRFLWRIDSIAQRFLFGWLVLDVTIDLAFNWTSLLYETVWCQASALGRFNWHSEVMQLMPGIIWNTVPYAIMDFQMAPPFWAVGKGQSGVNGCRAFAACEFEPRPGHPVPGGFEIQIRSILGSVTYGETIDNEPPADGFLSLVVSGNIPPFTEFAVMARHTGAWALYGKGVVFAIEAEDQ